MKKFWTDKEEQILRELWEADVPSEEITKVLKDRSVLSIEHRARQLKLKRRQPTINGNYLKKLKKIVDI